MLEPLASVTTDWLTAVGGVGAFAATVTLAVIGWRQIAGITEQTREARDAARAQLLPIVFAHGIGPGALGPNDAFDLSEGEVGFPYHLANEGTGVALNIRHGVEVDGEDYEFGDGMHVGVLKAGEQAPEFDPQTGSASYPPWVVRLTIESLPEDWRAASRSYWVKFSSVFGERYETRNSADPTVASVLRRLDDTDASIVR